MKQKIGQGHAAAMMRLGFHELQNALIDPGSNVAQRHAEPGSFGSPTQGEIAAQRKDEVPSPGLQTGEKSILYQHTRDAQNTQREAPEREAVEPERE